MQPKSTAYGLRLFHVAHFTSCGTGGCHQPGALGHSNPFPLPLGEAVAPTYYSLNNNNLGSPCSSGQVDLPFDFDLVGLDNDGDGFVDLADADCIGWVSTTTTTTTSTTTTALPVLCGASPALGCVGAGKSMLFVNEKSSGKEKLKVSLKNLASAVTQGQFGNPLSDGGTNYAICIYDDANQLVGDFSVSRADDNCGLTSIWAGDKIISRCNGEYWRSAEAQILILFRVISVWHGKSKDKDDCIELAKREFLLARKKMRRGGKQKC